MPKLRFSIVFTLFLAVFAHPCTTFAAGDLWANALSVASARSHPLAAKLSLWFYATQKDTDLPAKKMMDFVTNNPDWPRLGAIRDKIEREFFDTDAATIISWFNKYPPRTADGIRFYVDALQKNNMRGDAIQALKMFWRSEALSRKDMTALAIRYASLLDAKDHQDRCDTMIWKERYSEALDMLVHLPAPQQKLATARVALARATPDAEKAMAQVPASLQKNEGLLFERLRWRRKKDLHDGAYEIIGQMPAKQAYPEKWWKEIHIMARRAFENGDYRKAYDTASRHSLASGADYAQAEWFSGWLALRFLKQPEKAFKHFDSMYRHVDSAISHSRAAYWAGRAAEAAGNKDIALQWDHAASRYLSTYYGQLSYKIAYGMPDAKKVKDPAVTPADTAAFDKNELVRVIRFLDQLKLASYSDPFLAKLLDQAETPAQYTLIAKLAKDIGNTKYVVQANKDAQQKGGIYLYETGYPQLGKLPAQPEAALIHSIIYRESMFNKDAASDAGALGLMQLMPGTARMMAKKNNDLYTEARLTQDTAFNIRMGAGYLQQMLNRYDGCYPMAIAAYNAGPGNVDKWIAKFGDPRRDKIDLVDWVEHIPIYETRNYVQRVMETYYIYRLKSNKPPKTIQDWAL